VHIVPHMDRAIWIGGDLIPFDERIPVISEWITECLDKHKQCSSSYTADLPTRVIDVGQSRTSTLRLVENTRNEIDSVGSTRYISLSHCWGKARPATTLVKSNHQQWLNGFPLESLPKLFIDAVRVTRKCGVRYLWIDSLCIIQDDADDWQRESAAMAAVYENAHINIAAASATDSTVGLYIDELLPSHVTKFTMPPHLDGIRTVSVRAPLNRPNRLKDSPLHKRGWVLQESILSPRTVYFTDDQMHWKCRSEYQTEDGIGSWGGILNLSSYNFGNQAPSVTWWNWIEDFSSRQLAHSSDRLPAIAGITRMYQRRTGYTPLVALWEESILIDLLWSVKHIVVSLGDFRWLESDVTGRGLAGVPSWTWAAGENEKIERPVLADYYAPSGLRFLSSEVVWSNAPLTSPIAKAVITLEGRLRDMKDHVLLAMAAKSCKVEQHYEVPPGTRSNRLVFHDWSGSSSTQHGDLFRQDTYTAYMAPIQLRENEECPLTIQCGQSNLRLDRPIPEETKVYGLLMSHRGTKERILLLTPAGDGLNCYKRIGILDHNHQSMSQEYCSVHGWPLEEFLPGDDCRKHCRLVTLEHSRLGCFQDVELSTVQLV
jgi:hypothetical protein